MTLPITVGIAVLLAMLCGRVGWSDVEGTLIRAPVPPEAPPATVHAPLEVAAEATHTLHVWLRPLLKPRYTHLLADPPHKRIWPVEEVGWDIDDLATYETAGAVLRLISRQGNYRRGESVLAVAEREGLLDGAPPATPEEAFLQVVAEWIEMETVRQQARLDYDLRHVPPGFSWGTLSAAERHEILATEPSPLRDTAHLVAAAEAALVAWPAHPVADHARLALLWATLPMHAPSMALPVSTRDMIVAIGDPEIREQGALLVTELGNFYEITPDVLDIVYDSASADIPSRLRIDTWVMNRSAARGDWQRVQRSADRLAGDLSTACVGEPDQALQCDSRHYELRDARGRLIALGLQHPSTWREAISGEVWRCYLGAPEAHTGRSQSEWRWNGQRWIPGPWNEPTPITQCVDTSRPSVVPDTQTTVVITIENG